MKAIISSLLLAASLAVAGDINVKDQMKFGNEAAKQNLWNEAKFRWLRVLKIDPNNGAAHNNLGVALEREGKMDEALAEYKTAKKLLPQNEYVTKNLQRCEQITKNTPGKPEAPK